MEHMLPPAAQENSIKGCQLVFPDTAFYQQGKAKIIIKMDKEFCLIGVKKASKLTKEEIYKEFSNIVRDRRRDDDGIFVSMYGPDIKTQTK